MTRQPRSRASKTVRPAVEWISTSAAANSVAHLVGEAERAQPRLAGELPLQRRALVVAAPAEHDDRRAGVGVERRPRRAAEVADRPAAAADHDQAPVARQPQPLARVRRGDGLLERRLTSGRARRPRARPGAIARTSSTDSGSVIRCRSTPGWTQ